MLARRHDLPLSAYPIKIEALHPKTKAVVWSHTVEAPDNLVAVYIPPLRKQLGHPVDFKVTYADGTVERSGPSYAN